MSWGGYVPVEQYASYDCEQITSATTHINRRLGELYQSLENKASNDSMQMAAGLILFLPILFTLEGGDGPEAVEYARLKGESEALVKAAVQKKCNMSQIPKFVSPEEHQKSKTNKEE